METWQKIGETSLLVLSEEALKTMVDIDPELEHLYMPSNWVVRVPIEESVPLHVKVSHVLTMDHL